MLAPVPGESDRFGYVESKENTSPNAAKGGSLGSPVALFQLVMTQFIRNPLSCSGWAVDQYAILTMSHNVNLLDHDDGNKETGGCYVIIC